MTSKRELADQLDWYQRRCRALSDSLDLSLRDVRNDERARVVAETHPYVHLAEDLLTLIPDLNAYVTDGAWDFTEVSRAAEHRRGKDSLGYFEILVSQ